MPQSLPPLTRLILIVNTLMFGVLSYRSASLFSPRNEDLILLGARFPYLLAQGEWWRLITPIVLHVGLIHFIFNYLGLKYLGPFFERLLGMRWFLLCYVLCGIIGNIASSFTNLAIGAGASGALFGLIGMGMVMEWRGFYRHGGFSLVFTQPFALSRFFEQLRQFFRVVKVMPFTWLACINLAIALVFNVLMSLRHGGTVLMDNAAHLGGMGGGIALAIAYFGVTAPANTPTWHKVFAYGLLVLIIAGIVASGYLLCTTDMLIQRYLEMIHGE